MFTCFTIRAIHLKKINPLDNAVRRFISCRGCPSAIYCDNGTNLMRSCRELNFEFDLKLMCVIGLAPPYALLDELLCTTTTNTATITVVTGFLADTTIVTNVVRYAIVHLV